MVNFFGQAFDALLARSMASGFSRSKAPSFGPRTDGTQKGDGYFGRLSRPDGKVSTEMSFESEVDGQRVLGPLLVPTLSREELDLLLDGGKPTKAIYDKAIAFALDRIKQGKSPFASDGEQVPVPDLFSAPTAPSQQVAPW